MIVVGHEFIRNGSIFQQKAFLFTVNGLNSTEYGLQKKSDFHYDIILKNSIRFAEGLHKTLYPLIEEDNR